MNALCWLLACHTYVAVAAASCPLPLCDPSLPGMNIKAPAVFQAAFNTSRGSFTIHVQRQWAPHGADRFFNLVSNGFYDDTRFYRVIKEWVVQFGVSGNPEVSNVYSTPESGAIIADDEVVAKNEIGYVTFSAAYNEDQSRATNRTTELYINYQDNSAALDDLGFAPFGRVTLNDMESVVDKFESSYGEMADTCGLHGFQPCAGPREQPLYAEGNSYLDANFPLLDRIFNAKIVTEHEVATHGEGHEADETTYTNSWLSCGLAIMLLTVSLVGTKAALNKLEGAPDQATLAAV